MEHVYQNELAQLEQKRESLARKAYMQSIFLEDEQIPDIGPVRKATLASFGIETAYEVDPERIRRDVKGFGDRLTGILRQWKSEVQARFRFDQNQEIPEGELRALAQKYRQKEEQLLGKIERDVVQLEMLVAQTRKQFECLGVQLRDLVRDWAQARVDLEECLQAQR